MLPIYTRRDHEKFVQRLRRSVANGSVGASTARGRVKGTVETARTFLKGLDLGRFVTESEDQFRQILDKTTVEFRDALPERLWGFARKFLNIFLRDALYNRFLCESYELACIEPFLEVPLDRSVGMGLYNRAKERDGSDVPRWDAIKRLQPKDSDKYQDFARRVAEEEGCCRVDLDLLWYSRTDESENPSP